MQKYVYSAPFNEEELNSTMILNLINLHCSRDVNRIWKCMNYYDGNHAITRSERKGEKVVCNHAKDITDTATGYFMANPITYTAKNDGDTLDKLTDYFDKANLEDIDQDNALDMSKCGVAYEYVYAKKGESTPTSKNIDPRNCFIVIDDTIEENELFGVYYERKRNDKTKIDEFKAIVATSTKVINYKYTKNKDAVTATKGTETPHNFGAVPFICYQNNKDGFGDFEQQISLIDAYNIIMSDRVDDKEQFLKSILVVYGTLIGDDEKEVSEAKKYLKEAGILEVPNGTKVEYVTRTFDEAGLEILKNAIKEDIYTFSHVPCLTDKNFVGNSSGVAMEYKLLGLEMITKIKSRQYTKGLKKRIELYCNYLNLKALSLNPGAITVNYSRALPKNLIELSQMISNLDGKVSDKTLISQLPFVDDPDGEITEVAKQKEENMKNQQKIMGFENQPLQEDADDKSTKVNE